MKPTYPKFTADELNKRINDYFIYITGQQQVQGDLLTGLNPKPTAKTKKAGEQQPIPATITGLALYLDFNSLYDYEAAEKRGRFAQLLKRARLRIEAEYEKKLHQHSSGGAIFALKNLGWNDDKTPGHASVKPLKIQIIETGLKPAASEKEVIL